MFPPQKKTTSYFFTNGEKLGIVSLLWDPEPVFFFVWGMIFWNHWKLEKVRILNEKTKTLEFFPIKNWVAQISRQVAQILPQKIQSGGLTEFLCFFLFN